MVVVTFLSREQKKMWKYQNAIYSVFFLQGKCLNSKPQIAKTRFQLTEVYLYSRALNYSDNTVVSPSCDPYWFNQLPLNQQ